MTTAMNPYDAPAASVETSSSFTDLEVATRGKRLVAAIMDGLYGLLFIAPGMALLLYGIFGVGDGDPASWLLQTQAGDPLHWSFIMGGALVAVGYLAWIWVTYRLVRENGWTLGKRSVGIRVVRPDGEKISVSRSFFLRNVLPNAIANVPLVGPFFGLLDHLFIFGKSQRCIHDYFADSLVVHD